MANWNSCLAVLDGYVTEEVDFAARFARVSATGQQALQSLVERIAAAEQNPSSTAVVHLTGHADRQDAPGLTQEQRRASEDDTATRRVASAGDWFVQQIAALAGPADDNSQWPRILIVRTSSGAAQLVNTAPADESQRLTNRRIEIQVFASDISAFAEEFEIVDLN